MADRLSEGAGTDRVEGPRHPYRGGGTSEVQRLYVRTHARACSVGWRATYVRTYLRTYTGVRSERATSLPGPGARAYVRTTRAQTYTHVRTYEQPPGRGMRNRISWLIACQSVCAGTDGIRKGWGGNHEAPSPFALGGVALGPKGIACVHTYAHTRREAESDGGTRVRMRKCARTYVRIERAPSLPLGCARAYNARTYVQTRVRACDRGGDMRGHARTVRTHARGARETRT